LPATGFRAAARSEALIAAVMAAVLGVFVIWGIGFAPIGALHNAAHDTRHSMAFPCH
jgi:cobalt transporter subunit CbtB